MSGLTSSFIYAGHGFQQSYKERNFKIHVLMSVLVAILGVIFQITRYEWLALIFAISIVLAAEMFNTAIESLADIIKEQNNLKYGTTKIPRDVAAGAVLVVSLGSALVGCVIFFPYFLAVFT